jgi:hypothetical protein
MKAPILIPILFLTCCTSVQLSQDELEYQKFTAKKKSNIRLPKPPGEWNKTYKESGLQDFVFGTHANQQGKSLIDLDSFYKEVILQKYANHEYQEALKIKFIGYAVSAYNLTHNENAEATQHLIMYSRELAKNNHDFDAGLYFKCISHINGLIDKEEYNAMVKKALFEIRFGLELFEQSLAESKKGKTKEDQTLASRFSTVIEEFKQHQSNFEALIVD